MNHHPKCAFACGLVLLSAMQLSVSAGAVGDDYKPFEGAKSTWHDGFDRYDYMMDAETLEIQPFERPADEKFGIKDPPRGKRRCVVIVPRKAGAGQPLVVARVLLGPPAADRGRAAEAWVSRRVYLGQRQLEAG